MGEGHARRWQADALRESDGMRMARLCDDLRRRRGDHGSNSNNTLNSNNSINNHSNNASGGGGGGGKARGHTNGPAHDVKRVDSREGAGSGGGGSSATVDGVGGGDGNLSARNRRRASMMSPAGAALGGRLV